MIKHSYIDKINLLIEFLQIFKELEKSLIDEFPQYDPNINLIGFTHSIFIKRSYYFSRSILHLFPFLKKDLYFKIPIGVILRTSTSDVLTFYYFMYLAKTCKDESTFTKELKCFLAENLHFIKEQYKIQKNKKEITEKYYNKVIGRLYWKYEKFIDPDTSDFFSGSKMNFGKISSALKSHPEMAWTGESFQFYDILSKYEHIGAFTFDLQEVHTINPDFDINSYSLCITYIYEMVISILKMYGLDERHKRKIAKLRMILESLKGDNN